MGNKIIMDENLQQLGEIEKKIEEAKGMILIINGEENAKDLLNIIQKNPKIKKAAIIDTRPEEERKSLVNQ